jgi:hypothetical protein
VTKQRSKGETGRSEDQELDENHPRTTAAPQPFAPSGRSSASAAAKLILCGEHAVVYGRPAIALPLVGIRARVDIADGRTGSGISIHARDLHRRWLVANDPRVPKKVQQKLRRVVPRVSSPQKLRTETRTEADCKLRTCTHLQCPRSRRSGHKQKDGFPPAQMPTSEQSSPDCRANLHVQGTSEKGLLRFQG